MASIRTRPGRAHGQARESAPAPTACVPSSKRRNRGGRWLGLGAGAAATVPVVAATVEGLREGATATGDRAIILTRAWDVFSSHTPLVGQFSASSLLYDHILHSLGPLLYWLLAVPVRIGPAAAPAIAIGATNALAIVAAVALARRRGGVGLALGAALALAIMCRSLSPETLHDVWNPSAGLLPFTVLLFACWSLACGEKRLLPLAVVAASFAVQCELMFLAPSVAALALGMAGLASTRAGRRTAWRWWTAALIAGLVCWSAPLVDELSGHPGNLTLLAEAAFSHGHTIGARAGWRAVVRAVGIPPWWLTSPHDPFGRLADLRRAPSQTAAISCVVLLAGLVMVVVLGIWRRRKELAWAGAIGLALGTSLAVFTASTPSRPSLEKSLGYMLWVGSPIGMWVWLTLAFGVFTLLVLPLAELLRRYATRRSQGLRRIGTLAWAPAAASLFGLAGVWAVSWAVAASQGSDQDRPEYGPVKTVQAAVRRALAGQTRGAGGTGTVLVTGSHRFTAFDFRAAVIYDLRRRGWRVYAPAASERLGAYYQPPRRRPFTTVWIFDEARPPRVGKVIERLAYGQAPRNTITVTVSPARAIEALSRRPSAVGSATGKG